MILKTEFQQFAAILVEKYGEQAQLDQIQEELCELAVAINHYRRNKNAVGEVAYELMDVLFMLEQLKYIIMQNYGRDLLNNTKDNLIIKIQERINKWSYQ